MSIFKDVWTWLKSKFEHITQDVDKVAIAVTQQIKNAAESGAAAFIAHTIDGLRGTGIAEEVLGVIKLAASKALALELAILMPSGDVTAEGFLEWEQRVLTAAGVHPDKSALWTKVAATVLRDVQAFTQDGSAVTFAEAVIIVEDAYQASKSE